MATSVFVRGLATAVTWLTLVAPLAADIEWPAADDHHPVTVTASRASRWRQGHYEVWLLRDGCRIQQGTTTARAAEGVVWIDRTHPAGGRAQKVICYLEGEVTVDHQHAGAAHKVTARRAGSIVTRSWLGRFQSTRDVQVQPATVERPPPKPPGVVTRAQAARDREAGPVRPVQFTEPTTTTDTTIALGNRRIVVSGRSDVRPQAELETDPVTGETVIIFKNGIRATVEGIRTSDLGQFGTAAGDVGTVILEADRLVMWAPNIEELRERREATQPADVPLEVYLEGHIVFIQGDRRIYAERMYYNVAQDQGVVLSAELFSPVPEYEGLLRLKADVLEVVDRQRVQAYGAAATSSLLGTPRYWFQSQRIELVDQQRPAVDPITGQLDFDPRTGQQRFEHDYLATSRNNSIYVGGVPIFYWPTIATNLTKPTYYLDRIRVKNDSVFGTQILADWDMFQLLGIRRAPEGVDWTISTDYLSERGFGFGTNVAYERESLFGLPGPSYGFIDAWGIQDTGLDDLGLDRRGVPPEQDFRGRILANHRQQLPGGWQLTGELGLVSDRNFLESFYENEWDTFKDQITGIQLKRLWGNQSLSVTGDVRLNDFFTQTESLPRVDHFIFGQPLLFDWLSWSAHSQAGYLRFRPGEAPTNPFDVAKFDPLPWEVAAAEGVRAATRHEINLPVELGPVKVAPYAVGEVAHWNQNLTGDEVTRLFGQVGVRASLPMWRADPTVRSELFNLNGLAHKIVFETDVFWSEADQDFEQFPLYDPINDDSVEFFERRFFFDTFGGVAGGDTPRRFDPRTYAIRSGIQRWVSGPSTELAEDLMTARLGVRQRLQTRRGLPGRQRTVDWVVFDVEGIVYPEANRDNFGETLGMLDYDFRWNVGDRLALVSDGYADFFGDGLRTVSVGGIVSRPDQGRLYLGYRSIEGPITSNIGVLSMSYKLGEKWIATVGANYDFGPSGNIGQRFGITRIGESLLVRAGVNVDSGRRNVGFVFTVEPRFLPRIAKSGIEGIRIPPPGVERFE